MIKGLILSLQFFTHIPINIPIDFNHKNIRYSIFFLPLVGLVIGGISGLIYLFLSKYNLMIASFMTLLSTIILTGGLHLDGLSDTFDGFLSNRDKNSTLEIMRDSRVGAFGVLSIVLIIIFKFILIFSIKNLPLVLIFSFINSRIANGWIMATKKPARDDGLGKMFRDSEPKTLVIISIAAYSVVLILLNPKYIITLLVTILLAEYISHISYKKIGGLTGDVYGAIIEIGDAVSLLSFWGVMTWI